MDILYTAVGHATGDGRNGHVHTDDGVLDLDVRIPTEMGGPGGGTNPEQLFALGYSACFHSAIKFVAHARQARHHRLRGVGHRRHRLRRVGRLRASRRSSTSCCRTSIATRRVALVDRAHEVCPYSNATRGNIDVKLNVID